MLGRSRSTVAGTLGRRIASVHAVGGTDVRIFDLSAEQSHAAVSYAAQQIEHVRKTLSIDGSATGRVTAPDNLAGAVRGAWMVNDAVPERVELKREVF